MLFRIVEHYETENEEIKEKKEIKEIKENQEIKECFVCFEFQLDNNYIINLKNQTDYFKFCECDGYIHVDCLNLWYEKNEKCPICRNPMKLADSLELYNVYQYQYCLYIIYSYICTKRIIAKIFLFLIKFTHCFFLLLFVFIIVNTINKIYKDIIYELEKEMYDNYLLDNYKEPLINRIVPLPYLP
jgi:hypothetical protein